MATFAGVMLARRKNPPPAALIRWDGEVDRLPLGDDADGECVVVWGRCWTDAGRERALEDGRAGLIPWMCQRCAGKVCPRCGGPERRPLGSEVVDAEGAMTYLALLPTGSGGCRNASCVSRRS